MSGSFAEAAGRFAAVAAEVKTSQLARTGAKVPPDAPGLESGHPQAGWNRRFAVLSLRPDRPLAAPGRFLGEGETPQRPEPPQRPAPVESGPIGLAIGKPVRRNWVRRLF